MALGHRILVPLDSSPFAERVLPLASAVARHADGTLHLVGVHQAWSPPETPPVAAAMIIDAQQQARQALESYLGRIAGTLCDSGVRSHAEVRVGLPDMEILAACKETGCELIAMATHGRSGFRRLWLGSVADRVVRTATVPVLLVSARGEDDDSARPADEPAVAPHDVRTVIIPLDGSPFSEEILIPATALGEAFAAEYVLFRSVAPPAVVGIPSAAETARRAMQILEHDRTEARRDLERVAAAMRGSGFTVTVTVAEESEPAPTLLRLAAATPDSVIAMTTHGRGGVRRAILGSVADKVVRASTRPVLLLRPAEERTGRLR